MPCVRALKKSSARGVKIFANRAVATNVQFNVSRIATAQPIIAEAVQAGRVKVVGAIYELADRQSASRRLPTQRSYPFVLPKQHVIGARSRSPVLVERTAATGQLRAVDVLNSEGSLTRTGANVNGPSAVSPVILTPLWGQRVRARVWRKACRGVLPDHRLNACVKALTSSITQQPRNSRY